jgi:hypothetical protein
MSPSNVTTIRMLISRCSPGRLPRTVRRLRQLARPEEQQAQPSVMTIFIDRAGSQVTVVSRTRMDSIV